MNVRCERKKDIDAIHELVALAFGQELEADLVDNLRKRDDFDPRLSLVAEKRGQIVGHILFTPAQILGKRTHEALSLAPLSVHPDHQRKGIGTLLTVEGLEECRRLGHSIVVVIGHPSYYPRFGFERARARGLRDTFGAPDEAFMVLPLKAGALDCVEGTVVLPPEFEGV